MRGLGCVLAGVLALLPSCRCSKSPPPSRHVFSAETPTLPSVAPSPSVSARLDAHELTWDYPDTSVGHMRVVVVVPKRREPSQRFPVLVALHGMGEATKGPEKGARGWVDDYWLPRAIERLDQPPLVKDDFLGMVRSQRLDQLNAALEERPFQGLIVVCPYTPVRLSGEGAFQRAGPFADFLVAEVLPRVRRETPAMPEPKHTGIDGVSLGGRGSIFVGLHHLSAFGVVGALQPAFDSEELSDVAKRARAAANQDTVFRLVTSHRDYYLHPTRELARRLQSEGVEPNLFVANGGHSYDFNRGPGVFEMLLFHDRALRQQSWP